MKSFFQKTILLLVSVPLTVLADWDLNLRKGATPISREIYDLHMLSLWIVTAIGIIVFGIMFWSIFHHRKSKNVKPAKFSHSTTVEIIWTIIPLAIIVALAVPATKLLIKMEDTSDTEITVKATGYQWKWKYDYLDEDLTIFSALDERSTEVSQRNSGLSPMDEENYLLNVDNPIVLPTDTKIRILTTANDVIHAWWVPDLGWKRDAIPGFINDNWAIIEEPGVYRGQCAEPLPQGAEKMSGIIIPKKTTLELRRILDDANGDVQVELSSSKVKFVFSEIELVSKVIDGTFPDYTKVIPQNNDKMLKTNISDLKGAIERVSAIAVSEETKSRGLKLIIENNKLQLLANSVSKGSAIEELDVQFAHDKLEIGFNSRYLLDIISEIDGTDVTLNFSDPAAPVLIIDDAEDNLFFVLMPMRI